MTVSSIHLKGGRVGVRSPEAAYVGGLEDVNERMNKDFSQVFEAKQVSGVLVIREFTAS